MHTMITTQTNFLRTSRGSKNSLTCPVRYLLVLFVLILSLINIHPVSGSSIICSKSEYVTSGIEFKKCQDETLQSFQPENSNARESFNPCPALKHIVYSCAETVRHCFDHRGWERGRQVLLELLALDFPDRHQCGVFDNRSKKPSINMGNSTEHASSSDTARSTAYDDEEIPQKLDGEKCSIDEEVVLLRQIRSCVHKEQDDMMHSLRYNTPFPSTNSSSIISSLREEDIFYFPTICEGLQQVSDKCYAVKLQECYDDHDVEYHMAYLLEDLKTNGVMLSSHMITGIKVVDNSQKSGNASNSSSDASSTASTEEYTIDISDCPVFDGSLQIEYPKSSLLTRPSSNAVITLAVIVSLLGLSILILSAIFLMRNFRLIPKLRARLVENTPYEDIIIPDQQQGSNSNPNYEANIRESGNRIDIRPTEDTNTNVSRVVEENNSHMISTLSQELENRKRQRNAEMMVNKFASIQDAFSSERRGT